MRHTVVFLGILAAALLFPPRPGSSVAQAQPRCWEGSVAMADEASAGDNRYIGVEKCKNCHEAKSKGSQYSTWKGMKHSHAWEALASDDAKKTAKEKGIDDPQKSDKCIKCHVTAFGAPAEQLAKSFDPKLGIQCEVCHGPGEKHFKARMAAASEEEEGGTDRVTIPGDEIIKQPGYKRCIECHNEESPQYKPFCFKKFFDKIKHPDPRHKQGDEEMKKFLDQCECPDCKGKK